MRHASRLLLAAALLAAIPVMQAPGPAAAANGVDPSTLGMFVGFNKTDRFHAVEKSLGTPLRWSIAMADRMSPQKMISSVGGQVDRGTLGTVSHRMNLVMTVPLSFGKGSAQTEAGRRDIRTKLQQTAAGKYDREFRSVARSLAVNGYPDAVIRLGHEFTGGWYPWSAQGNAKEYVEAYRHVHRLFRQESSKFRFEWNSARNTFVEFGPQAYPGDAYVDVVGLDVYYEPWKGDKKLDQKYWDDRYQSVLEAHRDFAIAHGKPVAYSEWGVGKVDEPDFVKRMYGWFDSLPDRGPGALEYQSYFNPPKVAYNIDEYPKVAAAYRSLFGVGNARPPGGSTPPTTTPPATTPPTTPPTTRPPVTAPPTTTPPTTTPRPTSPPVTDPAAPTGESQVLLFDQTVTHLVDQPAEVDFASGSLADFVDGSALLRLDITDKPTDRPVRVQVCAWSASREATCGTAGVFSDAGENWIEMPPIETWWSSRRWSSDDAIDMMRLVVRDDQSNSLLSTERCGTVCYSGPGDPAEHAPITFDASLLLVADGSTPSLPADWSGCPVTFHAACRAITTSTVTTTVPGPAGFSTGTPELSIKSDTVEEGDKLVFDVVLSEPSDTDVVVDYRTAGVTAIPGEDFRPADRTLVIPAGETRGYIGVMTLVDRNPEPRETLNLDVRSVTGANVANAAAVGVILG